MSLLTLSGSASAPRASFSRALLASLRENSPILLFVALFAPVPWIVARRHGIPVLPYPNLPSAYAVFIGYCGIALFCAFAIWYLYNKRIKKVPGFSATAFQRVKSEFLTRERILLALPVLVAWPISAIAFSYLKSVIPVVQPFYLDATLSHWDRVLHFGVDPWRLLAPLLNHWPVTFLINFCYTLWFFVFQTALVLQTAYMRDRKLRLQFLLTMALAWALIGNLAATYLSSAGPAYYSLVASGPDPYAPLMVYLRDVSDNAGISLFGHEFHLPLTALALQSLLWQAHANGDFSLAMGISAAPSMHIASTWIVARLCFALGKRAAIFGGIFLGIIFIGSIHLGWHYALDGYLAAAGAWVLWRIVGWWLNRPAVARFLWPEPWQA